VLTETNSWRAISGLVAPRSNQICHPLFLGGQGAWIVTPAASSAPCHSQLVSGLAAQPLLEHRSWPGRTMEPHHPRGNFRRLRPLRS